MIMKSHNQAHNVCLAVNSLLEVTADNIVSEKQEHRAAADSGGCPGNLHLGDATKDSDEKEKERSSKISQEEEQVYELDPDRFPDKIRLLLDSESATDALWWLPGGNAIAINKEVFCQHLLIRHFRGNKFTSVTRNFNRWGFRRVPEEDEPEGCLGYIHEEFRRDAPQRLKEMKKEVYVKREKDNSTKTGERPKKKVKMPTDGPPATVSFSTASLGTNQDMLSASTSAATSTDSLGSGFGREFMPAQQSLEARLLSSRMASAPPNFHGIMSASFADPFSQRLEMGHPLTAGHSVLSRQLRMSQQPRFSGSSLASLVSSTRQNMAHQHMLLHRLALRRQLQLQEQRSLLPFGNRMQSSASNVGTSAVSDAVILEAHIRERQRNAATAAIVREQPPRNNHPLAAASVSDYATVVSNASATYSNSRIARLLTAQQQHQGRAPLSDNQGLQLGTARTSNVEFLLRRTQVPPKTHENEEEAKG